VFVIIALLIRRAECLQKPLAIIRESKDCIPPVVDYPQLILQWLLGYNFSVAVWVGYIALFGIAVETGVVMVVYLHESLDKRIASGRPLTDSDIHEAAIEGAVHRLRPKLMTVSAVLASLIPILWASGIGSDVMKPIAAPMVGGMITSTIHVLILVPVFFVLMKERALRRGTLRPEPAE
jgi:copper/silver efflux system protein